MDINNDLCPFCGAKLKYESNDGFVEFINCPICGKCRYKSSRTIDEHKNEIASFLYNKHWLYENEHKSSELAVIVINDGIKEPPESNNNYLASIDEILAFYPKTFSQTIDKIMLDLDKKSEYFGCEVTYSPDEIYSAWFIKRYNNKGEKFTDEDIDRQASGILDYLEENDYIKYTKNANYEVTIKPNGLTRIDALQKNDANNKNVFVSMAFNNSTKETRKAIREGIIAAGYSPEFIDEIVHNKQIVPEMFRLIRECRFLILDISDPNYGAYYEAGFALGQGKEVIICCKEEVFQKKYVTEEERKYEKYLKPHFDIAQKQMLVWKDYDDLKKKLAEWIKSIIS